MALADQAGKVAADEIIAQIPGLEKFTHEELDGLKVTVQSVVVKLLQGEGEVVEQAGKVVQADLAPVVQQAADFNANVATLIGLLQRVLDEGVVVIGRKALDGKGQ